MNDLLKQVGECLRNAQKVAILTGAGISAESGIPTFRDALTGLWAKFNPADLATPEAFFRNPERVSRWYDERRCQVAQCCPNLGHLALARLQNVMVGQGRTFTLITQNVDRLHHAAGSTDVIELHGSLWVWRCVGCGCEVEERDPAFDAYPPHCACGGFRRPGVVWFGEMLPAESLAAAESAVDACDFFLSIGTSAEVYPAAGLIGQAFRAKATVLEVNPQETPFSARADWSIRGRSGQVLPRIVEEAFGVPTAATAAPHETQ